MYVIYCYLLEDGDVAMRPMPSRHTEPLLAPVMRTLRLLSGFFIDAVKPFLGVSPDSIITCNCCGKGVLEVKCPYCNRENLTEDDQKSFCLTKEDEKWKLRRNHSYYYQVETQMMVCKVPHCDFVVWTEKELAVERIVADIEFFNPVLDAVQHFFVYGLLPEILSKLYTRKPVVNSQGTVPTPTTTSSTAFVGLEDESQQCDDYSKLWCYCNEPVFGEMIMCDNAKCPIKWFHFDCLRMRSAPKGKWYCPSCRKLSQISRKWTKKGLGSIQL